MLRKKKIEISIEEAYSYRRFFDTRVWYGIKKKILFGIGFSRSCETIGCLCIVCVDIPMVYSTYVADNATNDGILNIIYEK